MNAANRVILGAVAALIGFWVLAATVAPAFLIVMLNGVYFGTVAAIIVAYGRLLLNAVGGVRPYDRVRQMTLGFFLMHVAYGITVIVSFYLRASGMDVTSTIGTAGSRYCAILAAILQVTAPDFGLGLFHGRDRKVLLTGVSIGLIVAVVMTLAQTQEAFAF